MSRYHPQWDLQPIFDAAEHWKTAALTGGQSVLATGPVWTKENVAALNEYFVENLDYGEGNFMSKLQAQLENAPVGAKQLAAEMLWLMLLCPSNIGADNKRDTVLTIWDWSGVPRPTDVPWLTDEVLRGVGSGGTAFNTHRWRELVFFIRFTQAFLNLDDQKQDALLTDGWALAKWIEDVPDADSRQLRHMILYLLFPDEFDRIFGRSDRRKLLLAFTNLTRSQIAKMSAYEVSETIQNIRREQEEKRQTKELDFYVPPLSDEWKVDEPAPQPAGPNPLEELTTGLASEHVLQALDEIDRDGYPPDAKSSTYDLIYEDRRYPPKYVLSLSVKYSAGEELPRQFFSGGKDSQAFKILKKLGFHIETKVFVRELIQNFLAQADEAESLVVSEYPKSYRGLKVNVSFGKGNFAKIPWVSFTGYEQTTSEGIYPVVLYYKSISMLIVAYGISETNRPKVEWQQLDDAPTIATYLNQIPNRAPERYGTSFVHTAFDISEEVDLDAIQASVDDLIGKYQAQFSDEVGVEVEPAEPDVYGIAEALDGLFIEEQKFNEILDLLRQKKNLILQGPPGVGKTFVCKRLAYALMGEKAQHQLGMVQFHQSYSYEDFIQGYRPSGTGFRLKNGIFHEFCEKAKNDPGGTYVFVIDEINRGNLSKVFGELMLLIESDKRGPEWAIPLTYSEDADDLFYIPENLYLIGLMNTADRSLAMVDYALRRRFGFAELTPGFDTDEFQQYMADSGADAEFVADLVGRLESLNAKISADTANLGPGYCIGHSFFCSVPEGIEPDWGWYTRIIKTEIEPLIREYYFDDQKQASTLVEALLRRG